MVREQNDAAGHCGQSLISLLELQFNHITLRLQQKQNMHTHKAQPLSKNPSRRR